MSIDNDRCPNCGGKLFWEWQSQCFMCEECEWNNYQYLTTPEEIEESEVAYLERLAEDPPL